MYIGLFSLKMLASLNLKIYT